MDYKDSDSGKESKQPKPQLLISDKEMMKNIEASGLFDTLMQKYEIILPSEHEELRSQQLDEAYSQKGAPMYRGQVTQRMDQMRYQRDDVKQRNYSREDYNAYGEAAISEMHQKDGVPMVVLGSDEKAMQILDEMGQQEGRHAPVRGFSDTDQFIDHLGQEGLVPDQMDRQRAKQGVGRRLEKSEKAGKIGHFLNKSTKKVFGKGIQNKMKKKLKDHSEEEKDVKQDSDIGGM